jgi:phage shock protein C
MAKTLIKKLYRSRREHVLAGVCGGVADYFDLDVSLVRLGVIAGACLVAIMPFLFGYLVAAMVIPLEPTTTE